MGTNELRIGSIYHSVKFNKEVRLTLSDFSQLESMCDGAELTPEIIMQMITPIPLTEELLLKFGIKPHNLEHGFYDGTCVGYWPKSDGWYFVVDANDDGYGGFNYTTTELKYIHELQNLYFAWNKEELKIK